VRSANACAKTQMKSQKDTGLGILWRAPTGGAGRFS
jgi:hypothetical protein